MNDQLILIGGGGHCVSCIDVIELENKYRIIGILDQKEKIGHDLMGYTYIGTDEDIPNYIKSNCNFLITIGQIKNPKIRIKLFSFLEENEANIATIVSPRSYVSKHAYVGKGSIVMHDVLINAKSRIGNNCIINNKALIEHGVVIEDHCHISTSAIVNGDCLIKEGTFLGSNSTIQEGAVSEKMDFIKANYLFKRRNI